MGDVVDHDFALFVGAFAPFRQLVEGRGQIADLVLGGDGDLEVPPEGSRAAFVSIRNGRMRRIAMSAVMVTVTVRTRPVVPSTRSVPALDRSKMGVAD
ncbi:hypothetical protein NQP46_00115 [Streptomyces albus]|nr:hypothetical protein NQP46_00115 [Streptomyces albus]